MDKIEMQKTIGVKRKKQFKYRKFDKPLTWIIFHQRKDLRRNLYVDRVYAFNGQQANIPPLPQGRIFIRQDFWSSIFALLDTNTLYILNVTSCGK